MGAGPIKNKTEKKEKKKKPQTKQTKCATVAVVYMAAVLWLLPDSKLCLPLLLVCVCVYISWAIEKTFRSCEGRPDSKEKRP